MQRLLSTTMLALSLSMPAGAVAQTTATDPNAAAEGASAAVGMEREGDRGAADPESVIITLGSQAGEIREILMAAGEVDAEALVATERAREVATQAIETTGILLPEGTQDTQVTTTRRSEVQIARDAFVEIEAALGERLAALQAGDAGEANRARLAVLQTLNDLPEGVRFDGEVADGENPTSDPGGAQPIIQQ